MNHNISKSILFIINFDHIYPNMHLVFERIFFIGVFERIYKTCIFIFHDVYVRFHFWNQLNPRVGVRVAFTYLLD